MALTDADRLQMAALALMRHSVIERTVNVGDAMTWSDITQLTETLLFDTLAWDYTFHTIVEVV